MTSLHSNKLPNEEISMELNNSGDACQNGPLSHYTDPPPTTEPLKDCRSAAPPGVAGFNEPSTEGVVLRKEALQSLKLSLHMQETDLCKRLFF